MRHTTSVLVLTFALGTSACFGGHRVEQVLAPGFPDLGLASEVQIKDSKGQVLLSGKFATSGEKKGESARRAMLTNPANDDWKGIADIKIERDRDGQMKEDEILVKVDGLPDDTNCVVMFDTLEVTNFMTDGDGEAEVHLKRGSLARSY
jgi:hypothetical protein